MKENYIYRFYSSPESETRVTVVGKRIDDDKFAFAVSKCSKKDAFVRKIGRSIAEGRLNKGKFFKILTVNDDERVKIKDFVAVAMKIANNETSHNILYNN